MLALLIYRSIFNDMKQASVVEYYQQHQGGFFMARRGNLRDTVIRSEVRESDGRLYKYELVMTESDRVSFKLPLYSVRVEYMDADGVSTEARAHEIFADVGKAIIFFERIVKNLATPIDLPYVVEDELTVKR